VRQACLRSEVRRLHVLTCFFRLLSRDRRIKGLLLCALLLISYNNFACSTLQYTASHSNPGWSCAVATRHTLPMRRCGVLATSAIVRSAPKPLQQFCLQYCTVHSRPLQPWMVLCCGKSAHSFEQVLRTAVSWQQVRAELLS
jgi:hypothetical protein